MTDSILIIEGEPGLKRELILALSEANFAVADVSDYPEALLKLEEFKADIIIMDEVLPSGGGMEACYQLRGAFDIPVVLLGEDSSAEVWRRVEEATADFYLVKPFSYLELVARVKAILRRYKERVP